MQVAGWRGSVVVTRKVGVLAACVVLIACSGRLSAAADPRWGMLANAGFQRQRIKATLFFAGQARDGSDPYGCSPASNLGLYTVHPSDQRNLNWHTSAANRDYTLDQMVSAGINTVNMSSWGESFLPCTTAWAAYAPMQTAPAAHDELFTAAGSKSLVIVPFIESRADWAFRDEFPTWTDGRVAPGTVSQIVELINRYLKNPSHPEWANRWAKVYDRTGQPRYAVAIIQASSNRLSSSGHSAYAAGFDALAQAVMDATGVKVGFLVDALPAGTYAPGTFRPTPEATGPYLAARDSVLGIQCFIPEVWVGSSNDSTLIAWKRNFSSRWAQAGIPFLMDVCPGYDAHIVFPGSVQYGLTSSWRTALSSMVTDYGADGMTYNAWNGYTEALVAVPSSEYGDACLNWLTSMNSVTGVSTMDAAKRAADYTNTTIIGAVTAAFMGDDGNGGVCPVGFAIENSNRASGIRVISSTTVSPGQSVLIRGTTAPDNGERVIEASSVTQVATGQIVPKPVYVRGKSTAGGPSGAQVAVVDDALITPRRMSIGTSNVGILMTISGRVTQVTNTGGYSGSFYVDDGSCLRDGSGHTGILCRPPSTPPAPSILPALGSYVVVTGVMGVRQVNGIEARHLWTTTWR